MKKISCVLLFICCISGYAQINFESGYYIDNHDNKLACFIKNRDWNNNPKKFESKNELNGEIVEHELSDVKEFGIGTDVKYVRANVDMDRSSSQIGILSREKKPIFKKEHLFLKVLVQGKHTLYQYNESGLSRFFYDNPKGEIEQLVYKKYLSAATAENNQEYSLETRENLMFRNQLWNHVKCAATPLNKIEKLKYYEKELMNYFIEINKCQ